MFENKKLVGFFAIVLLFAISMPIVFEVEIPDFEQAPPDLHIRHWESRDYQDFIHDFNWQIWDIAGIVGYVDTLVLVYLTFFNTNTGVNFGFRGEGEDFQYTAYTTLTTGYERIQMWIPVNNGQSEYYFDDIGTWVYIGAVVIAWF